MVVSPDPAACTSSAPRIRTGARGQIHVPVGPIVGCATPGVSGKLIAVRS